MPSKAGAKENPWKLKTPPGTSEFEAYKDEAAEPPALARISHQLSAAARDKAASTSLRLVSVLDVLSKYASAR